eukprot:gene13117-3654_t
MSGGKYTDYYYDQLKGDCPEQSMLHYHTQRPKGFSSRLYGVHDWDLSNFLHEEPESMKYLAPGPYLSGPAPTMVIMLDPSVDWGVFLPAWGVTCTDSVVFCDSPPMSPPSPAQADDSPGVSSSRTRVAYLSGRTIVYPDFKCETVWAHSKKENVQACTEDQRFRHAGMDLFPYAQRKDYLDPNSDEKVWAWASMDFAADGCVKSFLGKGIIYTEFEHWCVKSFLGMDMVYAEFQH